MKTLPFRLALEKGAPENPYLEEANRRGREAVQKLIDAGIIEAEGRRIRTDLPEDMREGSDRDFGG